MYACRQFFAVLLMHSVCDAPRAQNSGIHATWEFDEAQSECKVSACKWGVEGLIARRPHFLFTPERVLTQEEGNSILRNIKEPCHVLSSSYYFPGLAKHFC